MSFKTLAPLRYVLDGPQTNDINNRHGYKARRRSNQAFPKEGKVAITLDEVDLQPLAVVVSDG